MNLVSVLNDLYADEINVAISSFFDEGWRVNFGDLLNGWSSGNAQVLVDSADELAGWVHEEAMRLFPDSNYTKDALQAYASDRNRRADADSRWKSLSKRELETVSLLADGTKTMRQVALDMHVSSASVKTYSTRAQKKLGVNSLRQLSWMAGKYGIGE